MEKIGTPKVNTPKTEEEIATERSENQTQFKEQANARNKNRGLFEKMFGIGKQSDVDIAAEEAWRVNELIDQTIGSETQISPQTVEESGSLMSELDKKYSAVSDRILKSSEFDKKDTDTIKAEEFLRSKDFGIAEAIKNNEINQASAYFHIVLDKIKNIHERSELNNEFREMIADQLDTLVKANDIPGMKTIILDNRLRFFGLYKISKIPQEIINSPEIQAKFMSEIRNDFADGSYPERAARTVQVFIKFNLTTLEQVTDFFNSPEMHKIMTNKIRSDFADGYSPARAVQTMQDFIRLGFMTEAAAKQILDQLGVIKK